MRRADRPRWSADPAAWMLISDPRRHQRGAGVGCCVIESALPVCGLEKGKGRLRGSARREGRLRRRSREQRLRSFKALSAWRRTRSRHANSPCGQLPGSRKDGLEALSADKPLGGGRLALRRRARGLVVCLRHADSSRLPRIAYHAGNRSHCSSHPNEQWKRLTYG